MYKTKQKSRVLDFLKSNMSRQLSINEIIDGVCGDGVTGKSTIYRQISKMVEDGTLLRMHGEDSKSVIYQYMGEGTHCGEHFHLKCTECGRLIHLDCHHLENIGMHIQEEHKFLIDMKKTVLYGICDNCRKSC